MGKHLKRLSLVGIFGMVAVVLSGAEAGGAKGFDQGDLVGAYVGVAIGGLPLGGTTQVPVASLMKIVADGTGSLTLEFQRNIASSFTTGSLSCTYTIDPSGFGAIACIGVNFRVLLSNGGQQFELITPNNTDGLVIGGHFIRQ
jgi:hypothetical protein